MPRIFLSMFILCLAPLSVRAAESPGLSESAEKLAVQVANRLRQAAGKPTVAVFPFSNTEGRITAEMGDAPAFFQGEMIFSLTALSNGDFLVLNKAMLARRFKDRGVSPSRLDASDPKATAAILREVGIDVAVLGSLDGVERNASFRDVRINAGLYFSSGTVDQLVGKANYHDISSHTSVGGGIPRFEANRRLRVEVLVEGDSLPLLQCQNPASPFCGNLFLVVPRDYLGKEYQIRVTNRGSPAVDSLRYADQAGYAGVAYESDYDRQRLIGVAVFVDGINSKFLKDASGKFVPVSRPPTKVPRWLLTPPGYSLERSADRTRWDDGSLRVNDGRLAKTSGPGNSVLTLRGFQVNDKTAKAFVFSDAGESLAESIGITKEMGLISIYVFPEEIPKETMRVTYVIRLPNGVIENKVKTGTKLGRPMPNGVRGFQVNLVEESRQTWWIHYRLEGDPLPVPRSKLVAFEQ